MQEISNIGIQGYKEQSLEEIRASIINDVKKIDPNFVDLAAGLATNLIDVGSVVLKQNQGLIKYLFNGLSLNSVSDPFFDLVAQDYNMTRKPSAKSQCEIKIRGAKGLLIPNNTRFTNADKSVIFYNANEGIINSLGECILTCFSDNTPEEIKGIQKGDINTLLIEDSKITSIENLDTPTMVREIESLNDFRLRIQRRTRNLIQGSLEGLLVELQSLKGVDPLLISIVNTTQKTRTNEIYRGIEVIINGGDIYEIAQVINQYMGLSPKLLISNPSNNENDRQIKVSLKSGKSNYTIVFTRPKALKLELIVKPKLHGVISNNNELLLATQSAFIDAFKNLQIDEKINKTFIREVFIDSLISKGYEYSQIGEIEFDYKVDNKRGVLDLNGFFSEKLDDTYFILEKYEVQIQP